MADSTSTAVLELQSGGQNDTVSELADGLEKIAVAAEAEGSLAGANVSSNQERVRTVYTRKQLVHLSQSPLVKPPDGMPPLKAWFGEWNEQNSSSSKKDPEAANSNGALRDRRFRREVDDGGKSTSPAASDLVDFIFCLDGPTRPSFRPALSQPSQMGNFKHQPLRANNDRDRDTGDLRSLSDKFDREKRNVALPAHSGLIRNRDRDSAPHLTSERDGQQKGGLKKRNGESSDDWRRGLDPARNGRDEPLGRREKEDRDAQRSRIDTSRQRDSPPLSRRDKDDTRRDRERFNDADDDNRRWREDGRRRDRDRGRDRSRDDANDGWTLSEDRRKGARDRKMDDVRERDERREREREKEPAWMETYVPSSASAGILGGKAAEGEVDDIQAWKKDMKERELKAKGLPSDSSAVTLEPLEPTEKSKEVDMPKPAAEGQLDEIQLFKLMMKKEEQKRAGNAIGDSLGEASNRVDLDGLPKPEEGAAPGLTTDTNGSSAESLTVNGSNSQNSAVPPAPGLNVPQSLTGLSSVDTLPTKAAQIPPGLRTPTSSSQIASSLTRTESGGSRFLSLGTADTQTMSKEVPSPTVTFDPPRQSRLLAFGAQASKPSPQPNMQNAAAAAQLNRLQSEAFPSALRRPSASPTIPVSASQRIVLDRTRLQQTPVNGYSKHHNGDDMARRLALDSGGYNPLAFESGHLSNPNLSELSREVKNSDALRSPPVSGLNERVGYLPQSDFFQVSDIRRNTTPPNSSYAVTSPVSPFEGQMSGNQTTYSSAKGSRMAKFWKEPRDTIAGSNRGVQGQGVGMNAAATRVEQPALNNNVSGGTRNIQDLLTMLNNSAQHVNQGFEQGPLHQGPASGHLGLSGALNRHDSLSDPEEGRFAPDGLVPGLRPAAAPRSRDVSSGGLYANPLDDLTMNARIGLQRGGLDPMYAGSVPTQFSGQAAGMGRNGGVPQQILRNGPSPMNNFNGAQGPPQQRLPPGLANLGGRPPHEPQFMGGSAGGFNSLPPQFHGGVPQHAGAGQSLNGLQNPNLALLGNQGLIRGQAGLGQLGNGLGDGPNGLNIRTVPGGPLQNQMLGLGGPGLGQGMRGGPPFNGQQLPNSSLPGMNLRQHQMQPQLMQQLLPQQMQGIPGGQPNPNDLIALLMGEGRRD